MDSDERVADAIRLVFAKFRELGIASQFPAIGSMAHLLAVVRSGQAIAPVTQAAVPEDLRILPPDVRPPALPSVEPEVKTVRTRVPTLVEQFAGHLRGTVPAL